MKRSHSVLLLALAQCLLLVFAPVVEAASAAPLSASARVPDSQQMSKALQNLPWKRFKSIVEAVPKLKAGVDAYGPLGWQYVKDNYARHNWKKDIDRLDATQKIQLAELIKKAQEAR